MIVNTDKTNQFAEQASGAGAVHTKFVPSEPSDVVDTVAIVEYVGNYPSNAWLHPFSWTSHLHLQVGRDLAFWEFNQKYIYLSTGPFLQL